MISEEILKIYGEKLRIRVCGVLQNKNQYLLVNHTHLNTENIFWNFPGGALNSNETITQALKREFLEEVDLEVDIHEFIHLNEHISGNLHAIELYFKVTSSNLDIKLGHDPEINILDQWKWFTKTEILQLKPSQRPNYIQYLLS